MFDLTGKVALVTGASGGLGEAIARALHAQGASVVISGTRAEALEALKGHLGERAHAVPCDLADAASLEALPKTAESLAGPIDILVNNAGITRDNLFLRMRDEEWDQVISVDLTAVFRLSRAVLRNMMKKRWGRIVSVTSVAAYIGNPGQGNYSAAKAGIGGMTRSLAYEVATRNITVNCIAPGFIETPMTAKLSPETRKILLDRIPVSRFGTPPDVAAAVVYLTSEEAGYVTGQTLHANGGMAMF